MKDNLWSKTYEEYENNLEFMKKIDFHCPWRDELEKYLEENKIKDRFEILDI